MFEQSHVRLVTEQDLSMLLGWRNHPDVRRFMFTQHEISLDEHRKWFEKASQEVNRRLLIVECEQQPIGYVQFSNVTEGGVSDWGFYARPGAAKGTGRKLGVLALNYAFKSLNLHKVCGQAIEGNKASIAFHLSMGFALEGELREQQRIEDTYYSVFFFGLLASAWQPEKLI